MAPMETMSGSIVDTIQNPFPGLRPFREGEEHLFFGRESQINRMVDRLAATRFLAILGTSGSGKSSLVNCGLRPALHRGLMAKAGTSWRVAQFRPGNRPIRAMARALAQPDVLFHRDSGEGPPLEEIVEATLRMSDLGLIDIYEQAHLDSAVNLLIVADQFEEIFRYRNLAATNGADPFGPSEEATAFVKLLLEAQARPGYPIYVVLTMRSDFLGDCCQFERLAETINEGQFLVPRMTRSERRAPIEGPVAVGGGEISPVLLTRLINDVGENPDQLSILQHALNRTWAEWQHDSQGKGELSLDDYERIGAMVHALDRHAEEALEELGTERRRKICEKIFKALTDTGTDSRGIRRPTRFATLCELAAATPAEVADVVNVFRQPSRSFLMPPLPEPLEPDTVVDISHESLMRVWDRLKKWADEEAQSARIYRRLAETAALYAAGKASLWRDPDLQLALDWREKEQPTAAWAEQYQGDFDSAVSFLDKSKKALDTELAETVFEHRWRRSCVPAILIFVALVFLFTPITYHRVLDNLIFKFLTLFVPGYAGKLEDALSIPLELGPYFLLYLGLARLGKRAYRLLAFNKIVEEVSTRSKKAIEAAPRPVVVSPAALLQTSYAGFWRRFCAFSIDWITFWMGWTCLYGLLGVFGLNTDSDAVNEFIFAVLFAGDCLYQSLTITSNWQATLGMRIMRIMITDMRGNRLSFGRATARYFAKLLSYYTAFIGFFIQPFTKNKQTLHDLIARCVLLRRPPKTQPLAEVVEPAAASASLQGVGLAS